MVALGTYHSKRLSLLKDHYDVHALQAYQVNNVADAYAGCTTVMPTEVPFNQPVEFVDIAGTGDDSDDGVANHNNVDGDDTDCRHSWTRWVWMVDHHLLRLLRRMSCTLHVALQVAALESAHHLLLLLLLLQLSSLK